MPNRPGRLSNFEYRGFYTYFVTVCTHHRLQAFDDLEFGSLVRDQLLRQAQLRSIALLAYCLMPDHVHLLARGRTIDADLRSFMQSWLTRAAYVWRKRGGERLWQSGYHDHVLRDEEPFLSVARYVILNPVRAGMVSTPDEYSLVGSTEHSLSELLKAADEWLPI
jgi:REP element-mobilizing transposase RayT